MKRVVLLIIPALICGVLFISSTTKGILPTGKYIGLEPMYRWKNLDTAVYVPDPYIYQFPTIYRIQGKDTIFRVPLVLYPGIHHPKETDTTKYWFHSDEWFHEVTIEVLSDNCINVTKVPVYFSNGKKHYSESIGGFYFYHCLKVSTNRKVFFAGQLTDCTYCRKSSHAIMNYQSCRYYFDVTKKGDLVLKSDEYESIVYKKIKKFSPFCSALPP